MSHAFALVKCDCFVPLGICQIEINVKSCFLEMLVYWLKFLITKNTANLESSICILANDLFQFILVFNHFSVWDIVTSSELDCF